jgi:hypothetical protein
MMNHDQKSFSDEQYETRSIMQHTELLHNILDKSGAIQHKGRLIWGDI